ncbi:hypothetical protein LY76DRAFT_653489, partial [Colletotrichum caudatum]
ERLRNRRSARINHSTPSQEEQCRSEWPTVNRNADNDEALPETCTKHLTSASTVVDDFKKSSNRRVNCDMASGTYKPSPLSPDALSTLELSVTVRDSILEADSPLLSSDTKLPSKRATFNERVEVRTSPTYWQREHSEGDDPYAQFRHEHYHEELREGQKAVPLEDPLRDPDGKSAGQLHSPRYSVDEESFNSWSAPSASHGAFTTPAPRRNFSNRSSDNQPHPNTLYTSKAYSRICESGIDVRPSDLDEMRLNSSSRQQQSYSDNNFPCNQGKENQPCSTNPVAPGGSYPSFRSFDEHGCPGQEYECNWSSRHDDSCASHTDMHWRPQDPYSDFASRSAQNDKSTGFSDSFSGDYEAYQDAGLNATFPSKSQEATPDDQGFHQGSSDSHSARQHYSQPRCSYTLDRERPYYDTQPFNIYEDFLESQPRFPRRSFRRSADRGLDMGHDFPDDITYDADAPIDFSSTSKGTLHEPRLPSIGCAMEIPDDMSDIDVHNLLIPGYDNYVPWRKMGWT